MTENPYTIKKIYLKTICCQTIFCLKSGDNYVKLIPINTETGLLWFPKTNDLDLNYKLTQNLDNIRIEYKNKNKKKYYLTMTDNLVLLTKKYRETNLFFLNNLILDYNNMMKKATF